YATRLLSRMEYFLRRIWSAQMNEKGLVCVLFPEPLGKAKHQLVPLELAQPLGRRRREERGTRRYDPRGARRPQPVGGHLPVGGEGAVAVPAAFVVVLAQENHRGDAPAAVHHRGLLRGS